MAASAKCTMKRHVSDRHVISAIRDWWDDKSLHAGSSLWFEMRMTRDRRVKLWRPIAKRFEDQGLACRVPVSVRAKLTSANAISDVQRIVFEGLRKA